MKDKQNKIEYLMVVLLSP